MNLQLQSNTKQYITDYFLDFLFLKHQVWLNNVKSNDQRCKESNRTKNKRREVGKSSLARGWVLELLIKTILNYIVWQSNDATQQDAFLILEPPNVYFMESKKSPLQHILCICLVIPSLHIPIHNLSTSRKGYFTLVNMRGKGHNFICSQLQEILCVVYFPNIEVAKNKDFLL